MRDPRVGFHGGWLRSNTGNSPYPVEFTRAVARVPANEDGYAKVPGPAGGGMNFGITSRDYPRLAIEKLTREEAIAIYFRDFWKPGRYGELPAALAVKLVDLSVSMSATHATLCLERGLRAGEGWVVEDGAVGNGTIASLKRANSESLLAGLRAEAAGYWRLAANAADSGAGERGVLLEPRLERAYQ
jgi:lysozyme family protein